MSERLKEIENKFNPDEWFEGYYLNASDIKWMISQSKKLQWLINAIEVCNDETITPKELADWVKK